MATLDLKVQYCGGGESGFSDKSPLLSRVVRCLDDKPFLRKFHLFGYLFEPSHGPLLSKVMAANNTLQSFLTSGNRCMFEGDALAEIISNNTGHLELHMKNVAVANVEQLAEAILTNTTMKMLTLCCSELPLENTTKLCEALAKNSSLYMVTAEDVDEKLVADMHKVLRETGTAQRVKLNSVIKSPVLQSVLKDCHEITEVSYRPLPRTIAGSWNAELGIYIHDDLDSEDDSYFSGQYIPKASIAPTPELLAFSCLTSCSQLVNLQITLKDKMNRSCAEKLAQFLSSTKKLKRADLNFPTTRSATQVLLDAVSRNKSISTLIVSSWQIFRYHAEKFAELLESNETLNYLELHDVKADLILGELSSKIVRNKFLVSIEIDDDWHLDDEAWMFEIMEALRRNSSLLHRAAHFVMGKHNKRCGEAFEEVSRSLALSENVQQLAGDCESDAEERIRASRWHLDANFLAVAGVVIESVVCENRGEGRTQLDQIRLDNWLRVRSYLKLTDIKDTPGMSPCSDHQQIKTF